MNTSTASTTRAAVTQHWAGKAPSLSKGKWLKRALGAALKRDRSTCRPQKIGDFAVARLSRLPGTSVARTNGRRDVACDQYVVLKAHGAFEVPQTCRESKTHPQPSWIRRT